jgi:hypothetical protein
MCGPLKNKFEEVVAENPELKDRSIEDGDLYAHVLERKNQEVVFVV